LTGNVKSVAFSWRLFVTYQRRYLGWGVFVLKPSR